jgi:hypothetical protein
MMFASTEIRSNEKELSDRWWERAWIEMNVFIILAEHRSGQRFAAAIG